MRFVLSKRSGSTLVAATVLLFGLALVGCQDSLVDSTSDNSSAVTTARSGTSGLGDCDAVVEEGESIQDAVGNADSEDVVCVRPGTYDEQIAVEQSVTLRGLTPATSGNPVTVDGWVSLDADGSKLRRVRVTRSEEFDTPGSFTPDPFGIRITASNTVVTENLVESISEKVEEGSINGIQAFGADPLSNIEITDNIVRDYRNVDSEGNPVFGVAGIKVQADVSGVEVAGNEVRDLHSAFGFGVVLTTSSSADGVPENVTIENNTLEAINDGSVFDVFSGPNEGRDVPPFPGSAVGIEADAEEATVRKNNLLTPNGAENKDREDPLVAKCNWWGDRSGPFEEEDNPDGEGTWALERGEAEIEFEPWLNAPAPSNACVGGKTPGNGLGGGPSR